MSTTPGRRCWMTRIPPAGAAAMADRNVKTPTIRALNYALSNFDIPQMFKGDLVYDLPFGKGREYLNSNVVADAVLGGWQIATTFVLESGAPFTPLVGTQQQQRSSVRRKWFPNVIGNPNVANPSVGQWFNTCTILQNGTTYPTGCTNPAFAVPAPGTFGNAGRNILRGPGNPRRRYLTRQEFQIPTAA